MNESELKVSRNAPWMYPIEWASYRPLSAFVVLTLALFLIWRLLSFDDISTIISLLMLTSFQVGWVLHCYLLRFVRRDLVALREFDPGLEDFSRLMPSRRVAMLEMFACSVFAIIGLFTLGDVFFQSTFIEVIENWEQMAGAQIYLYVLLFFSNIAIGEVIIFSIRLVILMSRYAKDIRISIFRYRQYSVFSGVFVIVFSGSVILSCMLIVLGPVLQFDNVIATAAVWVMFAPNSLLVSIPIFLIARRLGLAKRNELARVVKQIDAETMVHGEHINPALEQLLTYERQVLDIWVWPFSTQIKQMLLFGLLPPLSWLLAAFIEIAVEGSL